MHGYVGNTDFDWYRFLAAHAPEEVNFWQPGGGRPIRTVEPFAPFFFKLKKPYLRIAGFGFLAGFSRQPAWRAWEAFGQNNGAATADEMYTRIRKYRSATTGPTSAATIGCLMIVSPVFFPRELWVDQPSDWAPNIVQGSTYDLTIGEGLRIWRECQEAAMLLRVPVAAQGPQIEAPGARYGAPVLVRPRLGQGTFRVQVTDAYDRACAVTGEHSLPVLDAAHIQPYGEGGPHAVSNGIALRTDIHRLFDLGYVTVDPDHRFRVSGRLEAEFNNGKAYYALAGKKIRVPDAEAFRPNPEFLAWHHQQVFVG